MRTNRLKSMALLAICGAMGMASADRVWAQSESKEAPGLEGSWLVQISIEDCALKTPIGMPFLSLLTFARGGTITETTSNPMFFPAERGPGHGVWRTEGNNTYKAATTAFITLNGALTRTQTITQTIAVDSEDSFKTTEASVKFYKPDGTLLGAGCAAATGKRIELDDAH